MIPHPENLPSGKKLPILLGIAGIALIICIVGATLLINLFHNKQDTVIPPHPTKTTPTIDSGTTQNGPISPLIFGTNMSLFASSNTDQILDSPATLQMLKNMHVRMVRMPVREGVPEAKEVQAALAIKSIGAVPLIILHGLLVADPLTVDKQVVQDMNQVFGKSLVYYEYGNEEDLNGISMQRYADSWNAIIPKLKQLAINAQFIGPVSYKYNRSTLEIFLRNAHPMPDAISWHEYDCNSQSSADACLAGIDTWNNHFTDARAMMQQAIGQVLPIMITEWNYAPDLHVLPNGVVTTNDGKHDNAAFMTAWTTKAIKTLAANRVFASMQYAVTNTPLPLIDLNNALTPQGAAFQTMYQQIIGIPPQL